MKPKKTDGADVESKAGLYRDIGIVVALLIALFGFTYQKTERIEITLASNIAFDDEEDIADITKEKEKPPPPPPPPEIEVVEDDEEIEEEQPDMLDPEIDEDFEVDLPEPDMDEEVAEEPVFTVVENMPEFPGGVVEMQKYVMNNVNYPEMEKQNNIEGVAIVQFVIDTDGEVTEVRIFPGTESKATENMRKEAIRVVETMPKWKPGKQRGKAVKVKYTLPVRFKLR